MSFSFGNWPVHPRLGANSLCHLFAVALLLFSMWVFWVLSHKMLAFELDALCKQEAVHVEATFWTATALNKNAEQSWWRNGWELSKMSSKQDFLPHWSSISCMLKRVLEQQKALHECVGKKKTAVVLSSTKWNLIARLVALPQLLEWPSGKSVTISHCLAR